MTYRGPKKGGVMLSRDATQKARLDYYFILLEKYQYDVKRVEFDVGMPGHKDSIKADIVLYKDDDKEIPYLVVDCKEAGISDALFERSARQVIAKALMLKAPYALFVSGARKRIVKLEKTSGGDVKQLRISEIPVDYGK